MTVPIMSSNQDATPTPIGPVLDQIKVNLAATILSWPQMVKKYGPDPTTWPASTAWAKALAGINSLY